MFKTHIIIWSPFYAVVFFEIVFNIYRSWQQSTLKAVTAERDNFKTRVTQLDERVQQLVAELGEANRLKDGAEVA